MPHLFNYRSRDISDNEQVVELFDHLWWLRNHYECDRSERKFDEHLKRDVLKKVDAVLDKYRGRGHAAG
jgi:hypothetical protein